MRKFIFSFIIASLMLFVSTGSYASAKKYDDLLEKVLDKKKIRCGYAVWSPALYLDLKTNKLSGIFYDLMNEVGKRLDLEIEWAEESGWDVIVEGLSRNRYDMICSAIAYSSARSKFIEFGTPVFYTPMYLAVKHDDDRFDENVDILNSSDYKIAVLEGELSEVTARQTFPKAKIVSMPQINGYPMLLKEIEAGKADVTMIAISTLRTYQKNNPNMIRVNNIDAPINTFPVSVGLPQGETSFNHMIDVTIGELINDGTVERLIKKHEDYPEAFLRVSKPYK